MNLIGVDEVASMIGVSASTIYWWRQNGKGPRSARIGKHVKFKLSEVQAWIDSQFENESNSGPVEQQFNPLGRRATPGAANG